MDIPCACFGVNSEMSKLYPTLLALLLTAPFIGSEALAHPTSTIVTQDNMGQFLMLNKNYRWACFKGSDHNVLGTLSRSSLDVGAVWRPISSRTSLKMELATKAANDPSSLSSEERRQVRALPSWIRSKMLALAEAKRGCEGGQTPTPRPTGTVAPKPTTPRPTGTVTPRPTVVPTHSQPTPTASRTATPRPTVVPTHNHSTPTPVPTASGTVTPSPTQPPTITPRNLPPLAASNNREATEGITTSAVHSISDATRGGPTRDTFRSRIPWTHIAFDDPIVFPGQAGRSHLHMFFGNARVNASTTAENIRSQCQSAAAGGTANCSGYWMPALMNRAGEVLAPDFSVFYYKAGYQVSTNDAIVPPQGLAMIVGNMMGSPSNNLNDSPYNWSCDFQGSSKGIPDCPAGGILSVSIEFPACWNGQDMGWSSPSDHKSHMARGENGRCPASHPVQIPTITLNVEWRVPAGGTRGLKLSSDMYEVNDSARGGYSMHADWIMGWDPSIMQRFIDNCNNAQIDCVVDNLGDGFGLGTNHQVGMYR